MRGFLRFLVGLIIVICTFWLISLIDLASLLKDFKENEIWKFILKYWFFVGWFLCSIFTFILKLKERENEKVDEERPVDDRWKIPDDPLRTIIWDSLGLGLMWIISTPIFLVLGIDWVIFTKLFPERENKELILSSSDNKDKNVLSSVKNSSSNKANNNYSSAKQETEIYKPVEKILEYANPVMRALISASKAELLEENEQKIVFKIPKERKSFFDQLNKEEKRESIKKILNKEIEFILSETPQLTEQSKQKEVVSLRRERNPEFPKIVKQAYDYSCAVCKKRIFDLQGNPEVEAAHIYPKALDGVDDIRNGLALCKSHHWAFDQGLFSISDEYQILVNQKIVNEESYFEEIGKYNKTIINLPEKHSLRPHSIFLTEHRRIHGFT